MKNYYKKRYKNDNSDSHIILTFLLAILFFISFIGVFIGYNFGIKDYQNKKENMINNCEHLNWSFRNEDGKLIIKCKKCGIRYEEVCNDNN